MKRTFMVIALVLAMVLSFGGTAMATSTTVDVNWEGNAFVGIDFRTNAGFSEFRTDGFLVEGSFKGVDNKNNPYNYGIDTATMRSNASVHGSGYISHYTERTASHESMYGPAGQKSMYFVSIAGSDLDSVGALTAYESVSYASQKQYHYDVPRTDPGNVRGIYANADAYTLQKWSESGDGDHASVWAKGTGLAELSYWGGGQGGSSLSFGYASGSSDSKFNAVGTGRMVMDAIGDRDAEFLGLGVKTYGDGSAKSASLQLIADWATSFNLSDTRMTVR